MHFWVELERAQTFRALSLAKYYQIVFFTPKPCSYTSSPIDGVAIGMNFFCIYVDTQDHTIYHVWIHFSYFLCPKRDEKPFGLNWNQTQVLLLHKCLL